MEETKQVIYETADLVFRKAEFSDWEMMYHNVWSREETARYMLWSVTSSEEEAMERMKRTMQYQEQNPFCRTVYEKVSGQAIGFAGVREEEPGIYSEAGIAIGPEFSGRGYGKEILALLLEIAFSVPGVERFRYRARTENVPSNRLAKSLGLSFVTTEDCDWEKDRRTYACHLYEITKSRWKMSKTGV